MCQGQAAPAAPTLADVLPRLAAEDAAPTIEPDLERTSASRLARLNTVPRKATFTADTADETSQGKLSSGIDQIPNGVHRTGKRSKSANSTVYSDLEPALSQLLQQPETQPSTGTPMARDLTEALTALASNKRLLSSMQASRSFSSPDLLSLAQHLHDSGQWEAVADRLQQEDEQATRDAEAGVSSQAGAFDSPHAHYGTIIGRPRQQSIFEEGMQRLPHASDSQNGKFSQDYLLISLVFCR